MHRSDFIAVAAAFTILLSTGPAKSQNPTEDLLSAITSAQVIELNFVWDATSPLLPFNPPYRLALTNTHAQTEGWIPNLSFASDMMYYSGQHGAPTIDALGHIGTGGKLYGGVDASASEGPGGLTALGIEHYPAKRFVNRGVMLDVARYLKVDMLKPGQEISANELEATAKAQGVEIRKGDSVLIRTGFGQHFEAQPDRYLGPRPGIGESGARWLGAKGVFLTGADTLTYDVFPKGGSAFPAHRILIAENGIYIVENLNLERLGKALDALGTWAFPLVMNPPRIRGATAAALNAFAILPK
jgi:kynurenine formamidase